MARKKGSLPERMVKLLNDADRRHGFPIGTMRSVLYQEVGGDLNKYLSDPTRYHYDQNQEGRRIAGHTGRVSTAFGPFGILESTGADPGFGVRPLMDKSLEEQVRFASDYLAARTRRAGSLEGGLGGYGEGPKYARQVLERLASFGSGPVAPGMSERGNIDLANRPVVRNEDGSISTVRSMSVNFDGKEYLIPTVSEDGRILNDDEAIQTFRDSGRHLGVFDTPENASTYARSLSADQAAMYGANAPAAVNPMQGLATEPAATPNPASTAQPNPWNDFQRVMSQANQRASQFTQGLIGQLNQPPKEAIPQARGMIWERVSP